MFDSRTGLAMILTLAAMSFALPGCASTSRATPDTPAGRIIVEHWAGGAHHRAVMARGYWYQTMNDRLLVLDPASGDLVHAFELGQPRATAPAVDLVMLGELMFIVLRDLEVIVVDLNDPGRPHLSNRIAAQQLGILPRHVSVAEGEVYASGKGGVALPVDGVRVFSREEECGDVVRCEGNAVTTIGRRIYQLSDDAYRGSASELHPIPTRSTLPGAFVFARRGEVQSEIGLMDATFRELDAERLTISMPTSTLRARRIDDRIWALTDQDARAYVVMDGELRIVDVIRRPGILDVVRAGDNTLAFAGTFGRALYRERDDEFGAGRTFFAEYEEIGEVTAAESDGVTLHVGNSHGAWSLTTGGSMEAILEPPRDRSASRRAGTVWSEVQIVSEDELVLRIGDREMKRRDPRQGRLNVVAAVDGRYWLGHEYGVTILHAGAGQLGAILARFDIGESVRWIFPLIRGGGAFVVTERGGFGVLRFEE